MQQSYGNKEMTVIKFFARQLTMKVLSRHLQAQNMKSMIADQLNKKEEQSIRIQQRNKIIVVIIVAASVVAAVAYMIWKYNLISVQSPVVGLFGRVPV